jgi:predicted nucleotidyltransferase
VQREEVIQRLAERRQELAQFGVQSLAIFGSVARDEGDSDSDIDILVEFEGRATFDRYMDLKLFLEGVLGSTVDLVTSKALKPRLRPYVEQEAICVQNQVPPLLEHVEAILEKES